MGLKTGLEVRGRDNFIGELDLQRGQKHIGQCLWSRQKRQDLGPAESFYKQGDAKAYLRTGGYN